MKKPLMVLLDEKIRLERTLGEMNQYEISTTTKKGLSREIQRDIYMIEEAIDLIEKHCKPYAK